MNLTRSCRSRSTLPVRALHCRRSIFLIALRSWRLRAGERQEDSAMPLFDAANPGSARLQRAGDGILPSRTLSADPVGTAQYSKRHLPHFEKPWAIYAVTATTVRPRMLSHNARTIV